MFVSNQTQVKLLVLYAAINVKGRFERDVLSIFFSFEEEWSKRMLEVNLSPVVRDVCAFLKMSCLLRER